MARWCRTGSRRRTRRGSASCCWRRRRSTAGRSRRCRRTGAHANGRRARAHVGRTCWRCCASGSCRGAVRRRRCGCARRCSRRRRRGRTMPQRVPRVRRPWASTRRRCRRRCTATSARSGWCGGRRGSTSMPCAARPTAASRARCSRAPAPPNSNSPARAAPCCARRGCTARTSRCLPPTRPAPGSHGGRRRATRWPGDGSRRSCRCSAGRSGSCCGRHVAGAARASGWC